MDNGILNLTRWQRWVWVKAAVTLLACGLLFTACCENGDWLRVSRCLSPFLQQALGAQSPSHYSNWNFEIVHLKTGRSIQGLVVGETDTHVTVRYVKQRPGERTRVVADTKVKTEEIERIDRLEPRQRELLSARLEALDRDSKDEHARLAKLALKPSAWRKSKSGALCLESAHFVLISDAREELVREAGLRLEQIYAAYTRSLPPRRPMARPTTILLVRSLAEYYEIVKEQGRDLLNPSFFDSTQNQIVCASDLERLGDELHGVSKQYEQLLDRLKEQKAALRKLYKNKVPPELLEKLDAEQRKLRKENEANHDRFAKARQRLFQSLYHEAFHAYFVNFVHASGEEVPRWLNEGLAQIFETAVLEAGELRIGHADSERLAAVKEALSKGTLVSLSDLLQASPRQFLVAHSLDKQVSNRYYLASWALSFYLTFERKKLGTPELDRYLHEIRKGKDPLAAFHELIGQPLPEFEAAYHQYLRCLASDGSPTALAKERERTSHP